MLALTEAEDLGEIFLNLNLVREVGRHRIADAMSNATRSSRRAHEGLDEGTVRLLEQLENMVDN